MNARRVEITLSSVVWDRLERARGDVPRAAFIKRALESALGEGPTAGHLAGVQEAAGSIPATPAPVRAPVVDLDAFAAGEVDHSAELHPEPRPSANAWVSSADLMWERQQKLNKARKK